MIEHLVFSGGGIVGFVYLGIIEYLVFHNHVDLSTIKTYHGTSIGTLCCVLLAMDYTVEEIKEYVVNYNWAKLFDFNISTIIEALRLGGMFSMDKIQKAFGPFLYGKDMTFNTTLQEFYNVTQKEVHFYMTNLTTFELVDVSHKTHPDWTIVEAIYGSSAIPIVFQPLEKDGQFFIDGAIFANYPMKQCLDYDYDTSTVLGMVLLFDMEKNSANRKQNSEYLLVDYLVELLFKSWYRISYDKWIQDPIVQNQYGAYMELSYSSISLALNSKQERERLIVKGMGIGAEVIEGKIHSNTLEPVESGSVSGSISSNDIFNELL